MSRLNLQVLTPLRTHRLELPSHQHLTEDGTFIFGNASDHLDFLRFEHMYIKYNFDLTRLGRATESDVRKQSYRLADVLEDLDDLFKASTSENSYSTKVTFQNDTVLPTNYFFQEIGLAGSHLANAEVVASQPDPLKSFSIYMLRPPSRLLGDNPHKIADFTIDSYGSAVNIEKNHNHDFFPVEDVGDGLLALKIYYINAGEWLEKEVVKDCNICVVLSGGKV